MALSPEAIISVVSLLVNLPPAALALWKLYFRARRERECASPAIAYSSEVGEGSSAVETHSKSPSHENDNHRHESSPASGVVLLVQFPAVEYDSLSI